MPATRLSAFDPALFLAQSGIGRKILHFGAGKPIFTQGGYADAAFYLQAGLAKLTVVSRTGKEAGIMLLAPGDFTGEESVEAGPIRRLATATAISDCTVLRIERLEMMRVIHEEHKFSDLFLAFLLKRSMQTQASLVHHLFNSSEKRLARILLQMADFDNSDEFAMLIPQITQEALAVMVGTTRPRVSFFMNRFRELGFVEYNGRIKVHKSLLKVMLHD